MAHLTKCEKIPEHRSLRDNFPFPPAQPNWPWNYRWQHNPYNGSYHREGGSSHPWGCLANIWIEITKSNKIIVYNQRWDQRTDWLLIHKSSTSITSLCTHKNHNVCCNVSSVFRQKKLLFAKNTKKTREGATVDVAYDYVMSWCNK